jgi:Kelch motif
VALERVTRRTRRSAASVTSHLTAASTAVLVAALLFAGCGSGGDSPGAGAGSSTTTAAAGAASTPGAAATPTTSAGRGRVRALAVGAAPFELAAPVSREVLLTDGHSLFVLGGLDAAKTTTDAVVRIDPAGGTSQRVGSLAPGVHDAAGVARGGRMFVIAGGSPTILASVQSLAFTGGTATTVGRLATARADLGAALVGTTMYAFGGGDEGSRLLADVDASSDGATWRSAGTLAQAVRYPAVAVVGGVVYLFGGVSTTGGVDTRDVQRYDPATGTTTIVARLPAPLSHAAAVVLDGQVFVAGGFVDNQVSAQVLRFDPATGAISPAGTLPAPVSDAAAVVVGGVGYLAGGQGIDRNAVAAVTTLRPG